MAQQWIALVTGASTGIGAATVRRLCKDGLKVVAAARRKERLARLAEETGCEYVVVDITDEKSVPECVRRVNSLGGLDVLVNNAGGARGVDSVAEGKIDDWRAMYELNVVGTLRMTQAFLPQLRERAGDIVFITSTAAQETYKGGAGYTAAKHAERMIKDTLRLELLGEPVRLMEIRPGMVMTEEFSLNRLGDRQAAKAVYAGVDEPLLAEDIADIVGWVVGAPKHVNVDSVVVRPVMQANSWTVAREGHKDKELPTR